MHDTFPLGWFAMTSWRLFYESLKNTRTAARSGHGRPGRSAHTIEP
jgi:hypothetical protein